MARIKVTPGKGASYTIAQFAEFVGDAIFFGDVSKVTSSGLTLRYDGTVSKITGTNIKITAENASGRIDTWTVFESGSKLATMKKVGFDLRDIDKAVDAEESGRVLALEKYLMSRDWFYIGTNADDVAPKGTRVGDGAKFDLRGDDVLKLNGGDDDVFAGRGDDKMKGGAGDDRLDGGRGDDKVAGGKGHDELIGSGGDDVLKGGGGRDVLDGGKGDDVLKGGGGPDLFVFGRKAGDDVIRGYKEADLIDMRGRKDLADFDDVLAAARNTKAGVVIDLGRDSLTIANVRRAELDDDDFVFRGETPPGDLF